MLRIPASDPRAAALVTAIHRGDVAALERHFASDVELANARIVDKRGTERTLLLVVADWPGHFPNGAATVAALVKAGADVNAAFVPAGSPGAPETPLHWAASSDDVAVLDALLDHGADIEAPGAVFTGGPAMSDAVVFAQWNCARRLLERGATTTIWQAAALGLLDRIQWFCDAEPAPTAHDITNALWHSCRGGQLAVAQFLVERGGDRNWVGYDMKTPVDAARDSGNKELVRWLVSLGPTRLATKIG